MIFNRTDLSYHFRALKHILRYVKANIIMACNFREILLQLCLVILMQIQLDA